MPAKAELINVSVYENIFSLPQLSFQLTWLALLRLRPREKSGPRTSRQSGKVDREAQLQEPTQSEIGEKFGKIQVKYESSDVSDIKFYENEGKLRN